MSIWQGEYSLADLQKTADKFMGYHLGIEYIELGPDFILGKMPVSERTKTPFGLLHGGASCVLAESLGSLASYLCIDQQHSQAVGIEINANHIRSAKNGFVIGKVLPVHVGRSIHVWEIKIVDESSLLICISRLTVKVINKNPS